MVRYRATSDGLHTRAKSRASQPRHAFIKPGSLFFTLPTRGLTGQRIMSSDVGGRQRLDLRELGRLLAEP